jgi:hexosaminidase
LGDHRAGISWCDPFKTWQNVRIPSFLKGAAFPTQQTHTRPAQAYTFDPAANLCAAEVTLVLGGQQLLWTEQSGTQNLDPIVWPRAAASAEVL